MSKDKKASKAKHIKASPIEFPPGFEGLRSSLRSDRLKCLEDLRKNIEKRRMNRVRELEGLISNVKREAEDEEARAREFVNEQEARIEREILEDFYAEFTAHSKNLIRTNQASEEESQMMRSATLRYVRRCESELGLQLAGHGSGLRMAPVGHALAQDIVESEPGAMLYLSGGELGIPLDEAMLTSENTLAWDRALLRLSEKIASSVAETRGREPGDYIVQRFELSRWRARMRQYSLDVEALDRRSREGRV